MITFQEAVNYYLELKGKEKSKGFFQAVNRASKYLIKHLGNRPLDKYTTKDAASLRDWLFKQKLTESSVSRLFTSIKAVMSLTINEFGIDSKNVFANVYMPQTTQPVKRQAIDSSTLKLIQTKCYEIDDDIRWLDALITDTGLRLSEAVGLVKSDINLNTNVPYVKIQQHPHRRLKTASSERNVPLVGSALWAANRLINCDSDSNYCFPRYTSATTTNNNSASASINKWLKSLNGKGFVLHGARHALRDRLRAIEAPNDMIDQIGGWAVQTVGQSYGNGYDIKQLHKWMNKITL